MTSDDLGAALRDRLADVHPNLDALASGATRRGRRIRTVRRAGATLGAAAVVAAVGVGVATMGGTSTSDTPQYASGGDSSPAPTPTAPTLQVGQAIPLGHGLTGTVERTPRKDPHLYVMGESTRPGTGTGYTLVISGPMRQIQGFWDRGFDGITDVYPGVALAVDVAASGNPSPSVYSGQAVTIHLDGWKQVGPVADDKQSLEGPGGAVADVVWHPGSEHASWVGDADKGADSHVWTSPVHDGVFVSIQGSPGMSAAVVQALGDSLTWN